MGSLFRNHASAFYGRISPGPTAYSPDDKQTSRTPRAPRAILGSKTKVRVYNAAYYWGIGWSLGGVSYSYRYWLQSAKRQQ